MVERLAEDEVHVWVTAPDEITDPDLLAAYRALMSAEERDKEDRFRFEKGRRECRVTRALVRTTLSRYAPVEPAGWVFERNAYGRPDLVPGQTDLPLRFNLSHTEGLVTCAVTLEREIGVDVEWLPRRGETVAIADRYFAEAELRALRALPAERQRDRFFHYWTLKESYIKARGLGLALPLERFSFHVAEDEPIRVSFDPRLRDDESSWQFAVHRPTEQHLLAVGARRLAPRDLTVRVLRTVPLGRV